MTHSRDGEADELAAALLAKDAELARFTRAVSHDLRNPLITARAFFGFLEADLVEGDAEKIASDMRHLERSIARMEKLLALLVSWSRSGRFAKGSERLSFAEVAREAVDPIAAELSSRGVEVSVEEAGPVVRGGREQLADLVRQLVEDASGHRAGVEGAFRIVIGARTSGENATVLTVSHPTVAPPAEPGGDDRARELEGQSLGVTLARRIVEIYGGRIWVERAGGERTVCFTLSPGA